MIDDFVIDSSKKEYPIRITYFKSSKGSKDILIYAGGSGSTNADERGLMETLYKSTDLNIISFSYAGREEGEDFGRMQTYDDLERVLNYVTDNMPYNIVLVGNSDGAIPVTYSIVQGKYKEKVRCAIYLDPANYYLDLSRVINAWTGFDKYEPDAPTTSSLLADLSPNTKVYVVHFTIRNCKDNRYPEDIKLAGVDNPEGHTRLNTDMIRSYFDSTPIAIRGEYIELAGVPHSYVRHGNATENYSNIAGVIKLILSNNG